MLAYEWFPNENLVKQEQLLDRFEKKIYRVAYSMGAKNIPNLVQLWKMTSIMKDNNRLWKIKDEPNKCMMNKWEFLR